MSLDVGSKPRAKSPCKITITDDEATNKLIRDLVRKRAIVKGRLTKFSNYLTSFLPGEILTVEKQADLKLRVKGTESLFTEFNSLQTKLEELVLEKDLESQLEERDNFEDSYYSIQARAECMLKVEKVTNAGCKSHNESIKLPTISVPTFDGSCEHWLEFRDTFISLVHDSTHISNIQKFHYLKSSLKSNAALVIDSLEFSADNYQVAWELILNRYNNTRLLIHNHVQALFNLQALNKESSDQLRKLIDNILKNMRALKLLGEPVDAWDTLIIFIVVSKLDKTTEREWEQHKNTHFRQSGDSKRSLKLDVLLAFLKDRADMLETLQVSHNTNRTSEIKKPYTQTHNNSRVHCNVSNTTANNNNASRSCLVCNAKHPLYVCPKFLSYDIDSRLKLVHDNNLCLNCMRSGHTADICRFGPCRKCTLRHNSLLHKEMELNRPGASHVLMSDNNKPVVLTSHSLSQPSSACTKINHSLPCTSYIDNSLCARYPCVQRVLLSTALVQVCDKYNTFHTARALLDSGSERCIITQSLCELLDYPTKEYYQEIRGIGNSVTHTTKICEIEIKSRVDSFTMRLDCIVLPNITSTFPALQKESIQCDIPNNMQLADPNFAEAQSIDILIGADKFWDLLCEGRMRLPSGPFLQNTRLGWLMSGPVQVNMRNSGHIKCNFSQAISDQLRLFWELEEPIKLCDTRTEEEKSCEDTFVKTTMRNDDGRFVVTVPLKLSTHCLGETRPQALNRFLSLEKRLQRAPEYKKLYIDFLREYEGLGHMTRVDDDYGVPNYFIPHLGAFRESSTTTKLRVVFDASAASSTGTSLNDLQCVGPPIQGDMLAILLRLRQHKYIACADVEKMYRQVLVTESQRDLHLILWRENPSHPVGTYRLNTVVYGTASAPFLAVRCLKELGSTCPDADVQRVIAEDFFVDDMITGHDNKNTLLKLCEKVHNTLQKGCFPLRKWIFNFECQESEFSGVKQLNLDNQHNCKTLGISWNNLTDDLNYTTQFKNETTITKRTILSHVSQVFDPLGLLCPTIVIAKVLLQKLWLLKSSWDDALPSDVTTEWNRFAISLSALSEISVPRYVLSTNVYNYLELHIFTDASQTAYGACAYIRTLTSDNTAHSRLLYAKAKVAPLKPVSIPRLELCGALLGARLYDKIRGSLHCQFKNIVFWTDSTIVLGWLRMAPNLLKTFVQNRVSEIHDITTDLPWRHVSGKINPADLASRGVPLHDLVDSPLWWHGPPFLIDNSFDCSDSVPNCHTICEDLPEVKSNIVLITTGKSEIFPFSRFSQYKRMQRAFAYVLRFIHNARNYKINRRSGDLTVTEMRKSELGLARLSQLECFETEYTLIINNNLHKLKSNLLKLHLFIDSNSNLIRVGGRIANSTDFDYNKKHPILISSKHRFSILLMRHEHNRLLHAAPQALLYEVRQLWWPVGGRNLVRQVVHECIKCKRLKGNTLHPIMGNLPKERLSPSYPFLNCGVDYAGPVLILNRKGRGAKTVKAYVCLFICFVTRAVHLELVSDLSSEAYILALKRFISRRGKPKVIYSDNGKNFVGAKNEFNKYLQNCAADITAFAVSQAIAFKFIPAYSPHFGGLWEAGVKSSKHHLTRVVGNAHLTFEELTTVLTTVEAILNSRPLSPLSSDTHDLLPLCPAHFLVGRLLTAPVYEDMRDDASTLVTRYQRVEQIRHHFWTRWMKEYVSELQTRCKWMTGSDTLQQGTLVVIKDDHLPPLKWQIGRIINTVSGKDGISRVADIRTATGNIRRSFSKICPLLSEDDITQQK